MLGRAMEAQKQASAPAQSTAAKVAAKQQASPVG